MPQLLDLFGNPVEPEPPKPNKGPSAPVPTGNRNKPQEPVNVPIRPCVIIKEGRDITWILHHD